MEEKEELEESEEIAFLEYQENLQRSKEARRNRILLLSLASGVYLLGLGIFASIVQTLLNINKWAGIIVGATLLILYTLCYIFLLISIFQKQSFDIELRKSETRRYSERKNNLVRFSIARNLSSQQEILHYLDKSKEKEYVPSKEAKKIEAFENILALAKKYPSNVPSFKHGDSILLAKSLTLSFQKDGLLYKKAKSLIMKRAIQTGALTALSQNTYLDMTIVAMKNIQLVKDLVYLYGFRPTTNEMNKIILRVLRNVTIALGLNTMPKNTSLFSKMLSKDSSNVLISLFSEVLSASCQLLTNSTMTYLIGRYTIKVMLRQYHIQEILRQESIKDMEMELSKENLLSLNKQVKEEIKLVKEKTEEEIPLLEEKKESIFASLFKKKEKKEKK